jgi:hypothetical protein
MAAIQLPNAVVTSESSRLTPNPISPLIDPTAIPAESQAVLLSPLVLSTLGSGYIGAPALLTAENATSTSLPTIVGSEAVPVSTIPVIVTSQSTGAISLPTIFTSESISLPIAPVVVTSEAVPSSALPVVVSSESVPASAIPVIVAAESIAASATPIVVGAETIPVSATPVIVAAETVPATSLPTALTANALPSNLPPFPLSHPRILYDNFLIGSSVTVSAGTNGNYVLIPNTADRWAFTGTGSDAIEFVIPANVDIDSVCIGAHNLGSAGATVQAFYDVDATAGGFIALTASQTPVKDTALMFHVGTSVSARRIQINITGASGGVFVGSIYAGVSLQMQRPYFAGSSPINLNRVTKFYSSRTETGNVIGREIRSQNFETKADFSNLSNDWYRAYFDPFVESARKFPYFYAWNLDGYATDVGYCETTEDIRPSYQGTRDLMSVGFTLLGVG